MTRRGVTGGLRPSQPLSSIRRFVWPFATSESSLNLSPRSRAPASTCTAPSASATPPTSTPSSCSTTSATSGRRTTWPASPGTRTAGSRRSPTSSPDSVEHGDSLGNRGVIGAGDVQWMTAGSGIIHQEMPQGDAAGRMHGFQLWANLPASLKMTPPRYQEVKAAEIPERDGR